MLIELTAGLVSKMALLATRSTWEQWALILALDIAPLSAPTGTSIKRTRSVARRSGSCGPVPSISFCRASSRRAPSSAVVLEACRSPRLSSPDHRAGERARVDVGRLACHERSVEGRGPDGGGAVPGSTKAGLRGTWVRCSWRCDRREHRFRPGGVEVDALCEVGLAGSIRVAPRVSPHPRGRRVRRPERTVSEGAAAPAPPSNRAST